MGAPDDRFDDPATAFAACDARLVAEILARRERLRRPVAVGLSGAQGSGKSTTARRLVEALAADGVRAVAMSLDDFYRTRAERRRLAERVHPLLGTRGVPGTHDVTLARETIAGLLAGSAATPLPAFDKTTDDRTPPDEWRTWRGPIDVAILEGWCVGARPQPGAMLAAPVNALERDEDADGVWRAFVNAQLAGDYRALFDSLDFTALLAAPGFSQVLAWRTEQEAGLTRVPGRSAAPMDEASLRRFIAHYERLTRWILADEPTEVVIDIDAARRPLRWRSGSRGAA